MIIAAYILAVFFAMFVISDVLPRYRGWRNRGRRVKEFENQYRAYVSARESDYQGAMMYHGPPTRG